MKPKLFIASSQASVPVVRELESALHSHCEVTCWDAKGVFGAGDIIIDRLIEHSKNFDFAVFVFGFDDFLKQGEIAVPRDNVLFEFGLFMSRVGRQRAIAVVPQMDGVKLKVLSDLNGVVTLRYDSPDAPAKLRLALTPVTGQLIELVKDFDASPRVQTVQTGDLTHPDVYSLLDALNEVVQARVLKSRKVKIYNLALDMESTWPYLKNKYLLIDNITGISWKALMIDPDAPSIRDLESETVSTEVAEKTIERIQDFMPENQESLADRSVQVQVKAYSSVPMMHGFLVDEEILFLSFCGIKQVKLADGTLVNQLIGSPTAYWQFEKNSSNPASEHFVTAFISWFNFLWQSSRPIWPGPRGKDRS